LVTRLIELSVAAGKTEQAEKYRQILSKEQADAKP